MTIPIREWNAVQAAQHRRLDRLTIRRGASELKRRFDAAHEEAVKRMRAQVKRVGGDSFSSHQARQVVAGLRHGEAQLAARLAGETKAIAKEARGTSGSPKFATAARWYGAFVRP